MSKKAGKIDFEFYASNEASARFYCEQMTKLSREAKYNYDRQHNAWKITVFQKK